MPEASRVLLTGHGLLHRAVADQLRAQDLQVSCAASASPETTAECDLVLTVTDGLCARLGAVTNRLGLRRKIPSMRAFVEPGRAVIGPCVLPGEPGCATCAETRRALAREHADEHAEVERCFADRLAAPAHTWLTSVSSALLVQVIAAEAALARDPAGRPATLRALYTLRLDDLQSQTHPFLPDPWCEDCGQLVPDTPSAAVIVLQPRRKRLPGSYRVHRLDDRQAELHHTYVDAETGLVRGVARDGLSVFPNVSARVGLPGRHGTEIGFGRSLSYQHSELTAVAESLERYGGIRPGGRRTVVRGSYQDLAQDALHPPALGLHAEWQYALPDFRFQRYRDDLVFDWVWGYSFGRQAPVLVPESYAYYGHLHRGHRDRPFVYEISNGCALGGCLEEAVLFGLIEVAERDAFLMAWYTRSVRSRIDPDTARDRFVPLMVDRIEDASGYLVHAFDVTTEHGVPACWVMAVDERGGDRPRAHIAAGAHLDPEKALANALLELTPLVSRPLEAYRANRPRAVAMVTDPFKVRNMDDHAVLYSIPEAFGRLSFLYDDVPTRAIAESFAAANAPAWQPDLAVDVERVVRRYLDTGLDVIVVDQTAPEHIAGGFRCVKVIVPGAIPMTFGYRHARTTGLARLLNVPGKLGDVRGTLAGADLNRHPHPFP